MRGTPRPFDLNALIRQLESGRDSALLRLTIAMAHCQREEPSEALAHLAKCVTMEPGYSAAWRLMGNIHFGLQHWSHALDSYFRALECAKRNGEDQLVRELQVRIKRSSREISALPLSERNSAGAVE